MLLRALLCFLIIAKISYAGSDLDSTRSSGTGVLNPDGMIIDSIIIDNQDIHSTGKRGLDRLVLNLAGKLHLVTNKDIVREELLFRPGDTYSVELAEETARNLRMRLALNDASIQVEEYIPGHLIVRVTTWDRWSLLGNLRIEREGGENTVQFGLHEQNFLGRNQFLAFDYYMQEEDDNYFIWQYSNDRVRGRPVRLAFDYSDDPTSELRSLVVSHPYYNLSQRLALSATFTDEGGRHDVYSNDSVVAEWRHRADVFGLRSGYRWGSYHRKIGIGLAYKYLYRDIRETQAYIADEFSSGFPEDSVYHQFTGSLALTDQQFIVERRINGFYYSEDITLMKSIELAAGRAFMPDFGDHAFDLVSGEGRFAHRLGANTISLAYRRQFWFRSGQTLRQTAEFTAHWYNTYLSYLTGVLRGTFRSDRQSDRRSDLILGGKTGLRGFTEHYSSGDRLLLINLEGRFFPGIEILSVLVGGVLFADVGRAWNAGEPFRVRDLDRSVGIGLRLSFERLTRTQLVRIDLSCGQDNQWRIGFGSGQYF
ncbi:MAG: hypothetical protein JSU65_01075 [Candidatus Zixiibacteriota bacterium]|nr:MAG: hypothetical protein JSU65_01075 [candidate division Zixibacteria bacterium]